MRTFTITDELTGYRAEHVAADDIADTLRDWYPAAEAEVQQVIDELQAKVRAGEHYGSAETYLGIRVELEH
jgi:hypothetical protein